MCGVYMILCVPTGEYYIGGTRSRLFCIRFGNHRIELRKGRGVGPLLQAAWDRHGEQAFRFIPLRTLPPDQVARREAELIDKLRPKLNVCHMKAAACRARGISVSTAYLRRKKGRDPYVWIGPGRPSTRLYERPIGPKRRHARPPKPTRAQRLDAAIAAMEADLVH